MTKSNNDVIQDDNTYCIKISKDLVDNWFQNCNFSKFLLIISYLLGQLMQIELTTITGCEHSQHDPTRANSLNGCRKQTFSTMLGKLSLQIPKLRKGSYTPFFIPALKEMEEQVNTFIAKSYVAGVSERHITVLMEHLGLKALSKSAISSRIVKFLTPELEAFDSQSYENLNCPIIFTDALYLPIRIGGAVQKLAMIIVTGVTETGHRILLDLQLEPGEIAQAYMRTFSNIYQKGVRGVRMVIADGHLSIKSAVTEFYPGASLQLCVVHRIRKILSKFGAKKKAEVFQDLCRIYKADSYEQAKEGVKAFNEKYSASCPGAVAILNEGLEESLTFYSFPKELARKLYSTNQHERFNRTVRARLKTCVQFPDISACRRLAISWLSMFSADWSENAYFSSAEMDSFLEACAEYDKSLLEEVEAGSPRKVEKPSDFSRQTESEAVFTYTQLCPVQLKHQNRLVNASFLLLLEVDSKGMRFLDEPLLILGEESMPELEHFLSRLQDSAQKSWQLLVLEDGHPFFSGLIEQSAPQVSLKSFCENLLSRVPPKWKEGITENLNELCSAKDYSLAERIVESLAGLWQGSLPEIAQMLRKSLNLCFRHLKYQNLDSSKTGAPTFLNSVAANLKKALKEGADYIVSPRLKERLNALVTQLNEQWKNQNYLSWGKLQDALKQLGVCLASPLRHSFENLGFLTH